MLGYDDSEAVVQTGMANMLGYKKTPLLQLCLTKHSVAVRQGEKQR